MYDYNEPDYYREEEFYHRGRDKNRRAMTPNHYPSRGYQAEQPYNLYGDRRGGYDYDR